MSDKNEGMKNQMNAGDVPGWVKAAPELLPVWDWWVKEGRSTVLWLVIAAAIVGAFYGVKNWRAARLQSANQALANAFTTEEIETAVADFGSTKTGVALKLKLAKSYFDAEHYEDALAEYEKLGKTLKAGDAFYDITVLGRAYALEGLKKYAEAKAVYADYAKDEAHKDSYLLLTAQIGAARTQALAGDKAGAEASLKALKDAPAKDEATKGMRAARIDAVLDVIKRYDPARAERSLFDTANAVDEALKTEKKDTAKPAVAAPAPKSAAKK